MGNPLEDRARLMHLLQSSGSSGVDNAKLLMGLNTPINKGNGNSLSIGIANNLSKILGRNVDPSTIDAALNASMGTIYGLPTSYTPEYAYDNSLEVPYKFAAQSETNPNNIATTDLQINPWEDKVKAHVSTMRSNDPSIGGQLGRFLLKFLKGQGVEHVSAQAVHPATAEMLTAYNLGRFGVPKPPYIIPDYTKLEKLDPKLFELGSRFNALEQMPWGSSAVLTRRALLDAQNENGIGYTNTVYDPTGTTSDFRRVPNVGRPLVGWSPQIYDLANEEFKRQISSPEFLSHYGNVNPSELSRYHLEDIYDNILRNLSTSLRNR